MSRVQPFQQSASPCLSFRLSSPFLVAKWHNLYPCFMWDEVYFSQCNQAQAGRGRGWGQGEPVPCLPVVAMKGLRYRHCGCCCCPNLTTAHGPWTTTPAADRQQALLLRQCCCCIVVVWAQVFVRMEWSWQPEAANSSTVFHCLWFICFMRWCSQWLWDDKNRHLENVGRCCRLNLNCPRIKYHNQKPPHKNRNIFVLFH